MDENKKMEGKKKPKKKKNKTESKIDIFHLILSTFHKSTCPTLEFCGQNQRGDAQSLRLLDCLMIQQPPRKNCVEENHSNDDHNRSCYFSNMSRYLFNKARVFLPIKIFVEQLQKMLSQCGLEQPKKSNFHQFSSVILVLLQRQLFLLQWKLFFTTLKTDFTTMKTVSTTMKTVFYYNENCFYYNENWFYYNEN